MTDARFETSLKRWNKLDPTLKALAEMASAVEIGCSWCVDFGYWVSTNAGVDPGKLRTFPAGGTATSTPTWSDRSWPTPRRRRPPRWR